MLQMKGHGKTLAETLTAVTDFMILVTLLTKDG
jgi:hypothetical protein